MHCDARLGDIVLAERAGFEPAGGYWPPHAFQACDLNRSSTSPEPAIIAQIGMPAWTQTLVLTVWAGLV